MCVLMPCTSLDGTRDATINMLKLAERRPAEKTTSQNNYTEKKRDLSIDFCAPSIAVQVLMLTYSNALGVTLQETPSLFSCDGEMRNFVLTSSSSQHDAEHAKKSYVHVSWASPCNETNSLFSSAGKNSKSVC